MHHNYVEGKNKASKNKHILKAFDTNEFTFQENYIPTKSASDSFFANFNLKYYAI